MPLSFAEGVPSVKSDPADIEDFTTPAHLFGEASYRDDEQRRTAKSHGQGRRRRGRRRRVRTRAHPRHRRAGSLGERARGGRETAGDGLEARVRRVVHRVGDVLRELRGARGERGRHDRVVRGTYRRRVTVDLLRDAPSDSSRTFHPPILVLVLVLVLRPPSSSPPFHSPRRPRVAPNRRRYTRSFTTTIRPPCPPRR